jgi:hypothetical protein
MLSLGALLTLSGSVLGQTSLIKRDSLGLPAYDHIVIVIEENKYYDQVIGNA